MGVFFFCIFFSCAALVSWAQCVQNVLQKQIAILCVGKRSKRVAYRPTESVFVGEVLQGRLAHQGSSPRYGFSVMCGVQRPIGSWNLTGGTFIAVTEAISTLTRLNRGTMLKEVSLKRHG